jgi:hypothetical protein
MRMGWKGRSVGAFQLSFPFLFLPTSPLHHQHFVLVDRNRLEDEGRFEYAAFVALMTENGLRRAMQVLQNSEGSPPPLLPVFSAS